MTKALPPESNKARKIREALAEVRYALPSMPPEERKLLLDGSKSIEEWRWRAHSRLCYDPRHRGH